MGALVKYEVIDRVFISRWSRGPEAEDIAKVEEAMADASRRLGKPLFYVAAVTASAQLPDAQARATLNDLVTMIRKYGEGIFMLFEGNELQANLLRVIMSGVVIFTRSFNDFMIIAKNGDDVAEQLTKKLGKDARPIIQQARERGLIA